MDGDLCLLNALAYTHEYVSILSARLEMDRQMCGAEELFRYPKRNLVHLVVKLLEIPTYL